MLKKYHPAESNIGIYIFFFLRFFFHFIFFQRKSLSPNGMTRRGSLILQQAYYTYFHDHFQPPEKKKNL